MDENKMQQCTAYGNEQYLCVTNQPIYNIHDKNAPCEANVFSQQTSHSCIIDDVECKETWTILHRPNLWLFTLCNKHLIRVICDDQVTSVALMGTGLISLKPKCILQKTDATIYTFNHLGSRIQMRADIDVPTINSSINNMFNLNWNNAQLNMTELKSAPALDFNKIEQQLTYQKENEKLHMTSHLSVHDTYLYSVTTLLLGGILAVALYCYIKKKCMTRKSNISSLETYARPARNTEPDIEMQEIRNPTPADRLYSEVKTKQGTFRFD